MSPRGRLVSIGVQPCSQPRNAVMILRGCTGSGGLRTRSRDGKRSRAALGIPDPPGRMSGTRWRAGGVGGAEEAADSMADVEVVRECGGLGRRPRVKPDVDAVALAAVRVIHPYSDLAFGGVVAVGQYLVVETEVSRAGGSHRHHPEGRRCAVIEVGRDLRPLRLDCAPRQAPLDDDG